MANTMISDALKSFLYHFTKKDLARRDFTINAMAYNSKTGLLIILRGKVLLKKKEIKCVGNPTFRFEEDALRIMRAVRFSSQLDFLIEEQTKIQIFNQKEKPNVCICRKN